ncbi:hypothetical protein BDR26DRAFT_887522 [Obelidium mucronatum]|nr:hypothetical protein BDR26DRAFT_887522 [Obelidium mucronatum]
MDATPSTATTASAATPAAAAAYPNAALTRAAPAPDSPDEGRGRVLGSEKLVSTGPVGPVGPGAPATLRPDAEPAAAPDQPAPRSGQSQAALAQSDALGQAAPDLAPLRPPPRQAGPRLSSICHHSKRRSQCVQCYDEGTGGSTICKHRKQKYACRKCFDEGNSANSLCEHRLIRIKCKSCTPVRHEPKTYRPRVKFDFLDEKDLIPFRDLTPSATGSPSTGTWDNSDTISQNGSSVDGSGPAGADTASATSSPQTPSCLKCGKGKRVTLYGFEKRPLCKPCHKILQQAVINNKTGSSSTASTGPSSSTSSPGGSTQTPIQMSPAKKSAATKKNPNGKSQLRQQKAAAQIVNPLNKPQSLETPPIVTPTLAPSPTLNPDESLSLQQTSNFTLASSSSAVHPTNNLVGSQLSKPSLPFPTPDATPLRQGNGSPNVHGLPEPPISQARPLRQQRLPRTAGFSVGNGVPCEKCGSSFSPLEEASGKRGICGRCSTHWRKGMVAVTAEGSQFTAKDDITEDEVSDASTVSQTVGVNSGRDVTQEKEEEGKLGRDGRRKRKVNSTAVARMDVGAKVAKENTRSKRAKVTRWKLDDFDQSAIKKTEDESGSQSEEKKEDIVFDEYVSGEQSVDVLAAAAAAIASMEQEEHAPKSASFESPSSLGSSVTIDDSDAAEILAAFAFGLEARV